MIHREGHVPYIQRLLIVAYSTPFARVSLSFWTYAGNTGNNKKHKHELQLASGQVSPYTWYLLRAQDMSSLTFTTFSLPDIAHKCN